MKRFLILLLCLILLVTLSACSKKHYNDNLSADALAESALQKMGADDGDYIIAEENTLNSYFDHPNDADFTIRLSANRNNINEFGIFHATDENPSELARMLGSYLMQIWEENSEWYGSYIPEELPKLRDAEVRIIGNYAVYAILSEPERARFFQSIEEALTA